MKTYTLKQVEQITDFIEEYRKDYFGGYINALRILNEVAKDQWTKEDAFDAILRAVELKGK
jgi:hypothetical protein